MKIFVSLIMLMIFLSDLSAPGGWIELYLTGNTVSSSELNPADPFEGEPGPYSVNNLFDNNAATAWVEGVAGYGSGQYFIQDLGSALPSKIGIRNGYQKSESLYDRNSRVKIARMTLFTAYHIMGEVTEIAEVYIAKQTGSEFMVTLNDEMGLQEIDFPFDKAEIRRERDNLTKEFKTEFGKRLEQVTEFSPACKTPAELHYLLKFEIIDVYPGSSWDDTCISDFMTMGMETDPLGVDELISKVYEVEDEGLILFDTDIRKSITLVNMKDLKEFQQAGQDVNMALTLIGTSPDNEWAQVDFMFSATGAGTEEYPVLYHVRSCTRIGADILDSIAGMYGFTEKNGKILLETDQGPVDLEIIKEKMNNE
jgi:hypothetical protein